MVFSLKEIANELVARFISGPMQFRLVLQPATAICLGIRDGLKDAQAGSPPFLQNLLFQVGCRRECLRKALQRIGRPILVATLIDAIVQFLMFEHVRPLSALTVGTLMMGLPYSAARDLSNRLQSRRRARRLAA